MSSTKKPAGPPDAELKGLIREQSPLFMQATRLSFAIGMLALVPSWYMFEVYGRVLNSRDGMTLLWLIVVATGAYVVMELVDVARGRVLHRAAERFTAKLSPRVFEACFSANLRGHPGGTVQAVNDVKTLADFMQSPAVTGVLDLPASLICLVLMFAMSPWLGLLALGGAALQILFSVLQERRTTKPFTESTNANIEAQNRSTGIFRNAQVVESMGMGSAMYRRWMDSNRRFLLRLAEASDHAGGLIAATKVTQGLLSSLVIGLGCLLALHNSLAGGAGMIIVGSILAGRVLAPLSQLAAQWRQISAVQGSFHRLNVLLANEPPNAQGLELPPPTGQLLLDTVIAGAPGSPAPILKGISLGLQPGECMMVIGPSASGKSTLARLLVGVWATQQGNVRLDGADVYRWPKSQLGQYVGYLPQGVELFDGTIAENIARFGKVDPAKVREAADLVGITAMVEALPQGFDTRIGEDGAVLSGGQRQRLGLARAIYGGPSFLVLDEPNSSLDEAGERALLQMLMTLKSRGCTVVAITHRTTLLPAADRILVLADGKQVAFGGRDEILAALKAGNEAARAQQVEAAQRAPATKQINAQFKPA